MDKIITLTSRKYTYYVDYDEEDKKFAISTFIKNEGQLTPVGVKRGEYLPSMIANLVDEIGKEMELLSITPNRKYSPSELFLSRLSNKM